MEQHGVGHWKKLQQEQDLGHRSDVDLKDKWRNIVKSVKANKQMRGVVLGPEDIARVQVQLWEPSAMCLVPCRRQYMLMHVAAELRDSSESVSHCSYSVTGLMRHRL